MIAVGSRAGERALVQVRRADLAEIGDDEVGFNEV
jgi:hypothetical protein